MNSIGLGARLSQARENIGLTREGAALKLGYDRSTILRSESHLAQRVPLIKLVQFAAAYKTTLADLLAFNGSRQFNYSDIIIALIDDTQVQLTVYAAVLRNSLPNISIITFKNAEDALDYLNYSQVALVITDLRLPGMNGDELIKSLKTSRQNSKTNTLLMSDKVSPSLARKIAKNENTIFYDKRENNIIFANLVADLLRIS